MRKLYPNSRIEIWEEAYINNYNNIRVEKDRNVDIVQIEPGNGYDYIVEIVEKAEKEKESNTTELVRQYIRGGK